MKSIRPNIQFMTNRLLLNMEWDYRSNKKYLINLDLNLKCKILNPYFLISRFQNIFTFFVMKNVSLPPRLKNERKVRRTTLRKIVSFNSQQSTLKVFNNLLNNRYFMLNIKVQKVPHESLGLFLAFSRGVNKHFDSSPEFWL